MPFLSAARGSLARTPLSTVLAVTGGLYLVAIGILIITRAPLGSATFFMATAVTSIAFVAMIARVWHAVGSDRLLLVAIALAVAFRIPATVAPVGADNDMVRYIWDGRVQKLGHNPYRVLPSDPALAHTHTDETAAMPSRRARTPYPPAAQLFFRLVVTIHDSTTAMKLSLVGCDLLTVLVLWRFLVITGRNPWLVLTYAWHPLVVLEISHSGHIDALGALWTAAAAYWLVRRRTALAAIAFVLAIATKLLPIVLAPLFLGRVRPRDLFTGALFLAMLYVPFADGTGMPLGAVPNVVAHIRFNGPIFQALAAALTPQGAAAAAVALGLAVALWARLRLEADDPAAWAWPMAAALACAPVVYPWYLLYFTPFLFTVPTLPLMAWTFSVLPAYFVWELSRQGGRWSVPPFLLILEYTVVVAAAAAVLWRTRRPSQASGRP
ncbi:MAG TPA: hypothetical protein VD833_09325 [Vicinamibacterales bacterium]|nr:hypothetical protein [Vicinamibacterales bacterium]